MGMLEIRDELGFHFLEMTEGVKRLFVVDIDWSVLWDLYLDSFARGTNEIFRERRVYDCSTCRDFIRKIGNVVAIKNGKVETIWGFETDDEVFAPIVKALDTAVRERALQPDGIANVYLSCFSTVGCHHNFEIRDNTQIRWDHFHLELDSRFVARNKGTAGSDLAVFRTNYQVLKRSLDELTLDSVDTILELIASNSLYRGEEWLGPLNAFRELKLAYEELDGEVARQLFAWEQSVEVGPVISRIRNHSMGTLLTNLSDGMGLDGAVRRYESIVAPNNYRRSKPIFSQAMLERAQADLSELGFIDALPRRFATLDDITVNDILFTNRDAARRIEGALDIFGELSRIATDAANPRHFSHVDEIGIDRFLSDVLPTATSLEVFLDNRLLSNFVSLIAPVNDGVRSMFKWGSNFTWAYTGNMTDSMKERVKAFGGSVTGDLRFSIQWNEDGTDNVDVDAHCVEPSGEEIYYNHKHSRTKGALDVDIINPMNQCVGPDKTAVENITWARRQTMDPGTYRFFVHQYGGNATKGFRAEIEFDGETYPFDYAQRLNYRQSIDVAEVTLSENGTFSLKERIPSRLSPRTKWGLTSNEFVPVSVVCYSPNWWSTAAHNTGHRHVFFMLKGCVNDENPSGIFNEFLVQDLYEHRHVMEALANKMRLESTDDQLSGLGFATDRRAQVVVRVTGATQRVLKVNF